MAGYTRERVRIGATTVRRVEAMIRAGEVPGKGIEIADQATPGLILRRHVQRAARPPDTSRAAR